MVSPAALRLFFVLSTLEKEERVGSNVRDDDKLLQVRSGKFLIARTSAQKARKCPGALTCLSTTTVRTGSGVMWASLRRILENTTDESS